MNVSRLAILGIALVAGVAAFFLMMSNRPDDRAAPAPVVEKVQEETISVLVAARNLNRGERLTPEDTKWIDWPKNGLEPTFITNEGAREELAKSVARAMIVQGEPIVHAKIVTPGASGLMAAILSPGMRAVTLRITPETSSGGFILPGDRIDLYHTKNRRTRVLFENVRVLAVNTMYTETTEVSHFEGTNLTLEMTPDDAALFHSRRTRGVFSAVLRSIFKPEGEIDNAKSRSGVTITRFGES